MRNLKLTDEDWDDIHIREIRQTNSEEADIIFIERETREDAAKITVKAKNLVNNNKVDDPRLVMFVDKRATKRFNAIQNIARTNRQKSEGTKQTTIRNGRYDFLLRQKDKGDTTPWNLIPPLNLDQDLPDIEIGMFKNIYTPRNDDDLVGNNEEDDQVINDDIDDMDENETEDLSNEIRRQYIADKAGK